MLYSSPLSRGWFKRGGNVRVPHFCSTWTRTSPKYSHVAMYPKSFGRPFAGIPRMWSTSPSIRKTPSGSLLLPFDGNHL